MTSRTRILTLVTELRDPSRRDVRRTALVRFSRHGRAARVPGLDLRRIEGTTLQADYGGYFRDNDGQTYLLDSIWLHRRWVEPGDQESRLVEGAFTPGWSIAPIEVVDAEAMPRLECLRRATRYIDKRERLRLIDDPDDRMILELRPTEPDEDPLFSYWGGYLATWDLGLSDPVARRIRTWHAFWGKWHDPCLGWKGWGRKKWWRQEGARIATLLQSEVAPFALVEYLADDNGDEGGTHRSARARVGRQSWSRTRVQRPDRW